MGTANIQIVSSSGSQLGSGSGRNMNSTRRRKNDASNKRRKEKLKKDVEMGGFAGKRSPVQMLTRDQIEESKQHFDNAKPHHKVEIHIKCKDLVDLDVIGKSDPYAILYVKAENDKKWQKLGQTEVQYDCLNPFFVKSFMINYLFEKNQTIKCEIYDFDEEEHEMIGQYSVQLNKLLTAHK